MRRHKWLQILLIDKKLSLIAWENPTGSFIHDFIAEHGAEETERDQVIKTFMDMRDKLLFIEKDFKSFLEEPEKTSITQKIEALIENLQATKNAYISEAPEQKINLDELKQRWGKAIESHMTDIEKNIDITDVIYHRIHQAIQVFLKWSEKMLHQLGVFSEPPSKTPKKNPWIKEGQNTAKNAEEIRGFEKDLEPPEEKLRPPIK